MEQSWNEKTGCLISPAAPPNHVHATIDPESSHFHLENVQQPKLKEYVFLYLICAEHQEEGWPAEGNTRSSPALGNNVARRCLMEQIPAVHSPELTSRSSLYLL